VVLMSKRKYVPRIIGEELLSAAKEFPAVALTGPRQSGKTTLLKEIFPGYYYQSFDDPVIQGLARKDPLLFIEGLGDKAILDEIQYVPEILPFLKIAIDRDRSQNGRFILTGSQIFPLMAGITESLAGRIALFELLAFSFEEISGLVRPKNVAAVYSLLLKGFYPEPLVHGVGAETFYRSYLQTYLERDIRQIRSVEDLSVFQNFLELLAARVGNLLNLSEIGKECGISHTTAQKWLTLLEVTRIIYLLRPYHSNISKRVVKRPKIYFTDTGLLANLLKYSDAATLLAGPARGPIYENFIVMEALKNKFNHNRNCELYFYRDSNDNEIDLLIDYGQRIKLLEIKAAKSLREDFFAVLSKSHDLFKNKAVEMYLVGLFDSKIKHAGIETLSFEEVNRILSAKMPLKS
jgi:predicted AAA+ superfamily ATPase